MAARKDMAPAEDIVERVLAGAERCFERFGVAKTSVEDIARAAGVSRKTVYRYFDGGRDEIVLTVLLRRSTPEHARIHELVRAEADVSEALTTGVVETIHTIRSEEHLALLFAADEAGRTTALAGRSEVVFAATRAMVAELFDRARHHEQLRAGADVDDATEWIIRVISSFVTIDVGERRNDDDLRNVVRRFLPPAFFDARPAGEARRRTEPSGTGRRHR